MCGTWSPGLPLLGRSDAGETRWFCSTPCLTRWMRNADARRNTLQTAMAYLR